MSVGPFTALGALGDLLSAVKMKRKDEARLVSWSLPSTRPAGSWLLLAVTADQAIQLQCSCRAFF